MKNAGEQKIRYYVLFATRYRRKIFLLPTVSDVFFSVAENVCMESDSHIIDFDKEEDSCILYIEASVLIAPDILIKRIKAKTSQVLIATIKELKKAQNIWTRNYLISSEPFSSFTKNQYLGQQKRRG